MRHGSLVALAAALVVGCAPATLTYYKPVGPGSYFQSGCGGADNFLGFTAGEGLGVMIFTGLPAGREMPADQLDTVSISFRLGEGHSLRIPDPVFQVIAADAKEGVPITVKGMNRADFVRISDKRWDRRVSTFPANGRLEGGLLPESFRSALYVDFQNWRGYALTLPVARRGGKNFSIKFPRVLLDDRPIDIPDIRVEYGTYVHVTTAC